MKAINEEFKGVSILIPDGEIYLILGVLRCLSLLKGTRLYIMSDKSDTAVRYSRYVSKFIYAPMATTPEALIERINALTETYDIDIILPVFEEKARTLIQFRESLERPDSLLLPDTVEDFDKANNKRLLAKHLEDQGLPGPRSMSAAKYFKADDLDARLKFPLLVKPVKSLGSGQGIVKMNSPEELSRYFDKREPDSNVILQEYLEGQDLGCNVICREGEILAYTIQKGTIFSNKPFTPQVGLKMIHEDRVYALIKNLMKSLNWTGVANIDMRYNPGNDKYYVLEINTRFWYTVLASAFAGVNFPALYCATVLGRTYPVPEYEEVIYLNNKGIARELRKNPWLIFRPAGLVKNSPVLFQVRDILMTASHLAWVLRNILFGKRRHEN